MFSNFSDLAASGYMASGGSVHAGKSYVVGEKGPELLVPGVSGTVIPNSELGGGGGGQVFNVDMRGASVEAVQRLEAFVVRLNASIETRAVGAVFEQNLRGNRA